MKKTLILTFISIFCVSCGLLPVGYMGHSTNTQVVLSEANYKVVATESGEAQAQIFFGFGPSNKKLYAQAKSNLYKKLHRSMDLTGKSYALINITSDEQLSYLALYLAPLYLNKTVTVSADVIVFSE